MSYSGSHRSEFSIYFLGAHAFCSTLTPPLSAEPVIAQLVERRTVVDVISVILRSAVRLRLAG